jgi:hypothetical protein
MHWTKTKMLLNIKKFGRKKKPLDEIDVEDLREMRDYLSRMGKSAEAGK